MYLEYDNTIAITVNDWLGSGLTYKQFSHDSERNLLRIARRSTGGNTLIDFKSIRRPDRLAAIEAHLGKYENEATAAEAVPVSAQALEFYRSYTYINKAGMSVGLPAINIETYANEASLLDYFHRRYLGMVQERSGHRKMAKLDCFANYARYAESLNEDIGGQGARMLNNLPRNARRLLVKCEQYKAEGYESIIHGAFGNDSADRLTEAAKYWIIARWATPVNKVTIARLVEEYNAECLLHQDDDRSLCWKPVKSEATIRNFLDRPEVQPLWYGMRYGELKAKEKYTRQHRTLLPTMRDSIWYGDGTRLNLYYQDTDSKGRRVMRTANVYEVIDAYSECLLGCHISDSENFTAQYFAYREALTFSGCKPYEVRFDNQGGQKSGVAQDFFRKMAHIAISTRPYNGKSKTIESIFGRFQQQVLRRRWNFTGQNITATKQESHINKEFALANVANLPTYDEMVRIYMECRREWNSMAHYKSGVAHEEMYRSSRNPKSSKVDVLDMISIFGLINPRSCTYRASSIEMELNGCKYAWEVMTPDGMPDADWQIKNVGRKFFIGYDPSDMDMVALYTKNNKGDYQLATMASKYIRVHRGIQEQDEMDAAFIRAMEKQHAETRVQMQAESERIMLDNGVHPSQHGLRMPRVAGVKAAMSESIGAETKRVSNLDEFDCIQDQY